MREIKFRGKRVDNGEWVYGGYHHEHGFGDPSDYITYYGTFGGLAYNDFIKVVPSTVGQYTGLYDKNGKEIFEGDVVNVYYYDGNSKDQCGRLKGVDEIVFEDGCFKFKKETTKTPIGYSILDKCQFVEVIGNIHEVKKDV